MPSCFPLEPSDSGFHSSSFSNPSDQSPVLPCFGINNIFHTEEGHFRLALPVSTSFSLLPLCASATSPSCFFHSITNDPVP